MSDPEVGSCAECKDPLGEEYFFTADDDPPVCAACIRARLAHMPVTVQHGAPNSMEERTRE